MKSARKTISSSLRRTWLASALLAFSSMVWAADADNATQPEVRLIRLAFSAGSLVNVNHNDANASIIAWGKGILGQRGSALEVRSRIFDRTEDLYHAFMERELDATVVTTDEFFARPTGLDPDALFLSLKNGKPSAQYVLLVHQGSGIMNASELAGRNLELLKSNRTSLAAPWLDTWLAAQGLGLAETVFRKIERPEKVSRTVLRVFFRQTDACVVTREAFETMGELNPQLLKELRVLAISPEVVPSVFFISPDCTGELRQDIETAVLTAQDTVAGQQALTVFQGDELRKYPLSCLDNARDLLAAAARLRSAASAPTPVVEELASGSTP